MKLSALLWKFKTHFSTSTPLVKVYVSSSAILHNLHTYQKKCAPLACAPVLKSNAYGHGLLPIARILDNEKLPFFVVDSLYEARTLRKNAIKTPILIIGYVQPESIIKNTLPGITFCITSKEQLKAVALQIRKPIRIHIKVDTGMHRQGILPTEIFECIHIIGNNKNFMLEGICSHFADADNTDSTFTTLQRKTWSDVVTQFKNVIPSIRYVHISATAGTAYAPSAHENMVRLGLGLYGINPSPFLDLPLKPALKMTAVISTVKQITKGEHVGYNGTYCAERDISIATVPVGYFEGVDRRLSNCGSFKIGETFCPVIGRVSMNITSIDVTSVPTISIGDEVTIVSNGADDENSVVNLAKKAQTIPWEILIHIPQHLKRIVITDR